MSTSDVPGIRPHHCGVNVVDLDGSIKWYGEMLGFTVVKRFSIPQRPGEIAFLKNGDYYLELLEIPGATLPENPDHDLRSPGVRHVAFAVEDVHGVVSNLRSRGVEVIMEQEVDGKPMAFIRDNSGYRVELISPEAP